MEGQQCLIHQKYLFRILSEKTTQRRQQEQKGSCIMDSHIKIVFFDIDGTLIDMNKRYISKNTLKTLIRLKEQGILLCLSTGRSPLCLPKFEGVEADVLLTYNGSYCFNKEQSIFSNPIPNQDVKTIIENASSIHRPVSIATRDRIVANGRDNDLEQYYSFANLEITIADDFEEIASREEIYQLMLSCHESDYARLMENVSHANLTAWWNKAIDIIPANGGKGIGVKKVLEYYHLDKAEALAFGDGNNDINMFHSVGTGVAMENASEQLKMVADDICGHVENDGIYHYCIAHGLI